ncbi:MAG: ribose 5-phosphate isomerase A [Candidatus Hodarchaeales archaeon]
MNDDQRIESAKQKAAIKAIEDTIQENMIIGIGSGSTIVFAVKELARLNIKSNLKLICIPSSFQSYQLIVENGLTPGTLDQYPIIDVCIDGVDEIDRELNAIKGGGGCLLQEKIIAFNSKKFIAIADYRKISNTLGTQWNKGIPVEVLPMAYKPVIIKLEELGGKPRLRLAKAKMGPLVTDNGNFIIDVDFGAIARPEELNDKLRAIPGIVETGLFIKMISRAYIGLQDGEIHILEPNE